MSQKNIKYLDATIHYTLMGEGVPVMMLHGFAEDGTIWDNQVRFLKTSYKLIIPDLPGSGKSTFLNHEDTGMEDYAACMKAILDAEGINQCIMIGHSMGGYITLAFAEKYPEKLVCFGLFHSSAYADDQAKQETRKKAITFIKNNGAAAFLGTSIPGLFYDAEKSGNDIETLLDKGNNFSDKALIQYYEAMISRPDRTAILRAAVSPVLLIMGEHDKAVPFNFSLEQARLPGYTYVYILRKSAHMGMLEEPEKSNRILGDFLQMAKEK